MRRLSVLLAVPMLTTLIGLAVPPAHADLLVSSGFTDQVLRYDDTTGAFIGVFASGNGLSFPQGLAFGADGNLYVANNPVGDDNVLRFNGTSGAFIDTFASGGGLNTARGLTFGPDGNLYVSGEGGNDVLRYAGTTGTFIDAFASVNGPRGLTFGPDGNLYVASSGGENVQRFNGTTGAFIDNFAPADPAVGPLAGGPFDLTFGLDGNLYVGADANNNVQRYNGTTGEFIDVFAEGGGLATPRGVLFGPDGNLYVASRDSDQVLRYNGTTGAFIDVFASGGGLDFPTFLTFTPSAPPVAVPEPSTLLLLGAGLVGLWLRRKSVTLRAPFLLITIGVSFAVVPPDVHAVPVFTASTNLGGTDTGTTAATSSGVFSRPFGDRPLPPPGPIGDVLLQEFAASSAAGLRASARTTVDVPSPVPLCSLCSFSSGSAATASYDDFVITGPGSGFVPGSVNFRLNGAFETGAILFGILGPGLSSSISVGMSGQVAGQSFDGTFQQSKSIECCVGDPLQQEISISASATGILSGAGPLPFNPTTETINLPIGTPFSVAVGLSVGAFAQTLIAGTAGGIDSPTFNLDSLADFSNTLSFSPSGPVFNLPAGFTVNSTDALIVNNQFVGASAAVPEPATGLLIGSGLVAIVAARVGRRSRHT